MSPLQRLPVGPRTIGFVAFLILAELLLHHVGDYGKWVVQDRDGRLGWRLLPNQAGWSRHYDAREFINGYGYRDREWEAPAAAVAGAERTFRVAVVGNSITYGSGVEVEDTWPRRLEGFLAAEFERRGDPRRVVVMNFAVQGYVFEQMARVFEDQITAWQPDLLVIPTLAPDIRPMPPPVEPAEYFLRERVLRTAIYDLLRDRIIDKWIPPPAGEELEGRELKEAQLEAALPDLLAAYLSARDAESPDEVAQAEQDFERLATELRRAVMGAAPEAAPRRVWEVLDTPYVAAMGDELDHDLRLDLFLAFEGQLLPAIWSRIDGPVQNTPWTADHRFWWFKMAARLERIQRRLDDFDGRLALVSVTRLHEVLDENLPPDQQTVKPVDLFYETWLPDQAERRSSGRLFYTSTRRDFSRLQPAVTEALLRHGYLQGPRGTKRIDPERPGAEQSLFLFDDVGHFSPRGHAAFAELLARSLVEQGL